MDYNVASGKYNYRLKQIDFNGNYEYHNLTSDVNVGTPTKFSLSQNYPNPFNPTTNLEFGISELGFVSLKVFDVSGKEVATLVNETRPAGYYNVNFNATSLPSGVYYYRLESNGVSKVMKMA
ncbi:MAG: T9SS type A sorting domain-containing protein, partial [Candidatus Kapabacteria bacterium]|nr:T9SS type A sorting domain-containing protein [Candidatus Kapabacteria bacterium]